MIAQSPDFCSIFIKINIFYHEINLATEDTEDTERVLISWSLGIGTPSCQAAMKMIHKTHKKHEKKLK